MFPKAWLMLPIEATKKKNSALVTSQIFLALKKIIFLSSLSSLQGFVWLTSDQLFTQAES